LTKVAGVPAAGLGSGRAHSAASVSTLAAPSRGSGDDCADEATPAKIVPIPSQDLRPRPQDVAVSAAFLVTEIAEFGMLCGASSIAIAIERQSPETARLALEVESGGKGPQCDQAVIERFDRVVSGLARQLRSTLEREPEQGFYAVILPVIADTGVEEEPRG